MEATEKKLLVILTIVTIFVVEMVLLLIFALVGGLFNLPPVCSQLSLIAGLVLGVIALGLTKYAEHLSNR